LLGRDRSLPDAQKASQLHRITPQVRNLGPVLPDTGQITGQKRLEAKDFLCKPVQIHPVIGEVGHGLEGTPPRRAHKKTGFFSRSRDGFLRPIRLYSIRPSRRLFGSADDCQRSKRIASGIYTNLIEFIFSL